MTRINGTRTITRETDCTDRGVPLVVTLKSRYIEVRMKAGRKVYTMPYDAILWLAVKREVEERRREKARLKKERQQARKGGKR